MKLKKITAMLLALCMMTAASGCSSSEEENDQKAAETTAAESQSAVPAEDSILDTAETFGSMQYYSSSQWTSSAVDTAIVYSMPNESDSIVFQKLDGSLYETEDEDETIEFLAEKSQEAWDSFNDFTILEQKWDENIIPGKKCFVMSYNYEYESVLTTYTSVFFANFNDETKDVFSVSSIAVTEDALTEEYLYELLRTVTFSE
ncbi:MAG: hypothetical protein IJ512_00290 [Ruminococcus sp.]|nr:hypothetical protein [Ruminococcus sp.]